MESPNIKKDVNFVLKALNHSDNKYIHFDGLKKLIENFDNDRKNGMKWLVYICHC